MVTSFPNPLFMFLATAIKPLFRIVLQLLLLAFTLGTLSSAVAEEWIYTVRPGDNLWELSKEYLKDTSYFSKVQSHNGIAFPRQIAPGTELRIPLGWLKNEPVSARVVHVRGHAEVIQASTNQSRLLETGQLLAIGDQVHTGAGSSVSLQLADGSSLVIQSDSKVVMDTLRSYGTTGMIDTRLRLQRGRVESRSHPSKDAQSWFEIITPAAVTAVRGTEFRVGLDAARPTSRTEVLEGLVAVSGAGTSYQVPAGYGIVAEAGAPLQPPRALLSPPDVSYFPAIVETLPVSLSWPALEGAISYRIQVSAGETLAGLLQDRALSLPGYDLSGLPDGQYLLRLRGIDELGLEGSNAEHRLLVRRPQILPPRLLEQNGQGDPGERPLFSWTKVRNAVGYQIQVSEEPGFASLIIDQEASISGSFRPAVALPPGKYFWRVASRDEKGNLSLFSETGVVILEKKLVAPIVERPREADFMLHFVWHDPNPSPHHRYQFQLAHDANFGRLIADLLLHEQQVVLPKPFPGTYYFRVRSLDSGFLPGPFSESQRINFPRRYIPTWRPFFANPPLPR